MNVKPGEEAKAEVLSFRSEVGNRLRELEKEFDNREAAAKAAGVAKSTLQSWIEGKSDPSFMGLVRLCRATGRDINWIATGSPPREQTNQSTLIDSPLNLTKLEDAVTLIEEWLTTHRRTMAPEKKAKVIAMAYEILVESADSSGDDTARNNVVRLLRVAS